MPKSDVAALSPALRHVKETLEKNAQGVRQRRLLVRLQEIERIGPKPAMLRDAGLHADFFHYVLGPSQGACPTCGRPFDKRLG